MREMRTLRCATCDTEVERRDERDDEFVRFALHSWRCPGCLMNVHGRPTFPGGTGVSGIPLWLAEQFWTTGRVSEDRDLRDHLYAITREAIADAARTSTETPEAHAAATLVRIAHGLRAPVVPPHPLLVRLFTAIDRDGVLGLATLWRPFIEHLLGDRTEVTFMVRPPTRAGMFAFKYHRGGTPPSLRLHECYTVWRSPPADSLF